MSAPMTAAESLTMLKKWGISYKEHAGWTTHNRGTRGNGWSNMHGLVVHHTGSDGNGQENYLYTGSAALPGPLCHWGLDLDGVIHNIGWGRANHAGGGDPAVLNHVINEDYSYKTLVPHYGEGDSGSVDGNGYFYGVEIYYSGNHAMTTKQHATLLKLAAGILEHHKWSSMSVIGHGEWSNDKWDPGISSGKMMNMPALRSEIMATLKAGSSPSKPVNTGGTVTGTPGKDVPVATSTVYNEVWKTDAFPVPTGLDVASNKYWAPITALQQILVHLQKIEATLADLKKS